MHAKRILNLNQNKVRLGKNNFTSFSRTVKKDCPLVTTVAEQAPTAPRKKKMPVLLMSTKR